MSTSTEHVALAKFRTVAVAASARAGRSFAVAIVVASAVALGLAVPVSLQDWIASLPAAGLAVGAAALLGVLKGLLDSFPIAWEFVTKGEVGSLPKVFSQVAVAALGLGFAYYAAEPALSPQRHLNLVVSGTLPPLVMNESDALLTTFVVFDEKIGVLENGDPQISMINNLVDSLGTCVFSASDTIDVVVRAYASSSGTDAENEALYQLRVAYISGLIESRAKAMGKLSSFHIEQRGWKSLDAMKLRRLFRDTNDKGEYLKEAGALNRRAEIKVRSAGACMPA